VPHYDADLPITAAYRDALNRAFPDVKPTFGSLEGYVVATILCRGIAAIEGPVTRESIVDGLLGLGEFDIGLGVPLTLGPGDHQASNTVWPTIYAQGEVRPFDWTRSEAGGEE
jgi:hypothetical protein